MKKSEWVDLAKRRIDNILRKHLYASIRQLEVKISESGPFNQRAEPIIITTALNALVSEGALGFDPPAQEGHPRFYYIRGYFDPARPAHAARRDEVRRLQSEFLALTKNFRLHGDALETVVWNAQKQVKQLYLPFGSMGHPVKRFGDVSIEPLALDFTWMLKSELPCYIAGEAKNVREWIYPQSQELWGLLGKAVRLLDTGSPVLPLLVTRKLPYITYKFFQEIGIFGYQMHHQLFMPEVSAKLSQIVHKNGFGFHDITTDLTPPQELVDFLRKTVPANAVRSAQRFLEHKDLIWEYAVEQHLEDKKLDGRERTAVWRAFKRDLEFDDDPYDD